MKTMKEESRKMRGRYIGLMLFFICLMGGRLHGQQAADLSVLNEPSSLYQKNGRGMTGQAVGVVDDRLVFKGNAAGGSVEYSFSKDEVERLDFPGNELIIQANSLLDQGRYKEAVAIMEALYQQRARFFAFMPESDVIWFQKLADGAYAAGDYFLAVGVARNVRPYVTDARIRRELYDRELLAHYHLPLLDKTQALADEWVENWEPYGESALGWYVLGQLAYDRDEPDEALWLCLRPIVFSSQFHTDFLGHAYALAIGAAVEVEDFSQAEQLLQEMKERNLAWPEEPKLEAFKTYYVEGIPVPEEESTS